MRTRSWIAGCSLTLLISGCANWASVYRPLDTSSGNGALVDIKQRAIVAARVTDSSQQSGSRTIVCAEPSPDALSAYAAQLAAEASVPEKASAQLAASFQEGSSFVGLRTQSIQLLRDALYRLCEGYMSGALERSQYDILMRRYQKYMVALLGIEQLTGVVRAAAATISTSGSAEAARSLASLRAEAEKIDARIANLETQKAAADATDAQKAEIDKQILARKADKAAVSKAIEGARGLLASGSATAAVIHPDGARPSEAHLQAVSKTVERIVLDVVRTDDTGQLCLSYVMDSRAVQTSPAYSFCKDFLENLNKNVTLRMKAADEVMKRGVGVPDGKPDRSWLEQFRDLIPDHEIASQPSERRPTI